MSIFSFLASPPPSVPLIPVQSVQISFFFFFIKAVTGKDAITSRAATFVPSAAHKLCFTAEGLSKSTRSYAVAHVCTILLHDPNMMSCYKGGG